MKKICLSVYFLAAGISLFAQLRSLNDIYPEVSEADKAKFFSEEGNTRLIHNLNDLKFTPPVPNNFNVLGALPAKKYSHIVESVRVVPYNGKKADLLSIYNAFCKVRNLENLLYHSFSQDKYIQLFESASLVESKKRYYTLIADPQPALSLPQTKTMYLKLKDYYYGNTYYEAGIAPNVSNAPGQGLLFSLTNFRPIYYVIPVIGEGKLLAQLYIEPVEEGILAYSASGADVSNFVAKQISIWSVIEKRLDVFLRWMLNGLPYN
jgi:hypothetical protein